MSSAPSVPSDVEQYLADVREALRDLSAAERDDLLAEVEASLVETAEDEGPIAARLGPPDQFARELRAAAGLQRAEPAARPPSELGRRVKKLAARLLTDARVAALIRLARELAPIWWVVRGYLAVGALAYLLDSDWSSRMPVVPRIGSGEIGLALVVVAVVASVSLGLRRRRHGTGLPRLAAAANVVLLLAVAPVAAELADTSGHDFLVVQAFAPPRLPAGLVYDGVAVDNVSRTRARGDCCTTCCSTTAPAGRSRSRPTAPSTRTAASSSPTATDRSSMPSRSATTSREPSQVARPNAAPYVELPLVPTPPLPAAAPK